MSTAQHLRQWVDLLALRPNNWYLNQAKLDQVRQAWRDGQQDQLPPVLITTIDEQLSLIDGHSRAFAAYEQGQQRIQAKFQTLAQIGGSAALYRHIHRAGPARGIHTIADLRHHILPPEAHRRLWSGYCNNWLADRR